MFKERINIYDLKKLKEVFPNDWQNFSAPISWFHQEYNNYKPTNYDIFSIYFGTNTNVSATEAIWDKEYNVNK